MDMKKQVTIAEILSHFSSLLTDSLGDLNHKVNHFATVNSAQDHSLGFITSPKYIQAAEDSNLLCVLAPEKLKEQVEKLNSKKTWLFSKNVDLAAREIKKALVLETPFRAQWQGVHPSAIVDDSVELATDVIIGPNAVINKNVKIGAGSFIGANAVIEQNARIGEKVTVHPLAYIGHSCEIGNHCEILPQAVIGSEGYGYAHDHLGNHYRIPHSGKVVLQDDVHVGAGTAIDRGTIEDTIIGQGTKIDNQVHLAHNTIIGKNGLITAQVVTAGSTTIGDNFICGGKTAITGHIKITDNVHVAGLSGVSNNVTESGQYGGYPLQPLKKHLKVKASTVHLPELRKQMNRVLRKLFPEDFQ